MSISKRVRTIHVPIYEADTAILSNLPATNVSQWVRTMLLERFQGASVNALSREEVEQMIQAHVQSLENTYSTEIAKLTQEIQALKAEKPTKAVKVDTYTKAEIDQALAQFDPWKEEITANVLADVQEWLQEQESEPEPEPESEEESKHTWQKTLSELHKGTRA